jgi:hypothetical protein
VSDDIYVPAHPGDMLTANDWNEMQARVKQDIERKVREAVEALVKNGVNRAGNAERFNNKTQEDWISDLNAKYALRSSVDASVAGYRRYFKHLSSEEPKVFIHHKLGRFPEVQIASLCPVVSYTSSGTDLSGKRIVLYYGEEEADELSLYGQVRRDRVHRGIKLSVMLDELGLKYRRDQRLLDVVNDMWELLMKNPPNDEISHGASTWFKSAYKASRTIESLDTGGEWDDLYLGIRPEVIPIGSRLTDEKGIVYAVHVDHVGYDDLIVAVEWDTAEVKRCLTENGVAPALDVMILLRS